MSDLLNRDALQTEIVLYQRKSNRRLLLALLLPSVLVVTVAVILLAQITRQAELETTVATAARAEAIAAEAEAKARYELQRWLARPANAPAAYRLGEELGLVQEAAEDLIVDSDGLPTTTQEFAVLSNRALGSYADLLNLLVARRLSDAPVFVFGRVVGSSVGGKLQAADSFAVGDNPVIDLQIPESYRSQFLLVSFLDPTTGTVYNVSNGTEAVTRSRAWQLSNAPGVARLLEGPFLRVAWPIGDAARLGTQVVAFQVDDVVANNMAIAIVSPVPLPDRPVAESTDSYLAFISELTASPRAEQVVTSYRVLNLVHDAE